MAPQAKLMLAKKIFFGKIFHNVPMKAKKKGHFWFHFKAVTYQRSAA
jgi:hypothetical protein